jgi:hypothetical protein
MKHRIPPLLACFAPPACFLLLVGGIGTFLRRFPYYGPVNAFTGQPLVSHYPEVLLSVFLTLLAIGLAASFLILRRAHDGWPKILAGAGILVLIPVQGAFLLLMEISMFGK